MPMDVDPIFKGESIWGFKVGIFKDGIKLTDISFHVSRRERERARKRRKDRGGDGEGGLSARSDWLHRSGMREGSLGCLYEANVPP